MSSSTSLERVSFVIACKRYFGMLPGQKLQDFMHEVKALSPNDREYFKSHFPSVGFDVSDLG